MQNWTETVIVGLHVLEVRPKPGNTVSGCNHGRDNTVLTSLDNLPRSIVGGVREDILVGIDQRVELEHNLSCCEEWRGNNTHVVHKRL